ncbi:hypothetical protein [Blastococcus aggregatus]|uniref:hypothetical protein n=1 Tax=Blastococcus aggregatus TaxID=38502 RepID=UPI000BE2FE47|nr:hypothetical protein [Blastococcus aggregatus]
MTVDSDRSAALVVRVWVERGSGDFRARLTGTPTSPGSAAPEEPAVVLASSPDGVVDAVRAWLAEFLGDAPGTIDSGG